MKCRSCAADIAEKAIVCYRCGTPTAEPGAAMPAGRPSGRPGWLLAGIAAAILLVLIAWAVWIR